MGYVVGMKIYLGNITSCSWEKF